MKFVLAATITSDNPGTIKTVPPVLVGVHAILKTEEGFNVSITLEGQRTRAEPFTAIGA